MRSPNLKKRCLGSMIARPEVVRIGGWLNGDSSKISIPVILRKDSEQQVCMTVSLMLGHLLVLSPRKSRNGTLCMAVHFWAVLDGGDHVHLERSAHGHDERL